MARYEYRCKCGHYFEVNQSMHESPGFVCPKCGEFTKSRLSNIPSIIFKGEGWPGKEIARNESERL